MSADFIYFTDCSQCTDTVDILGEMLQSPTPIEYAEMLEHCVGLLEWSESVGYDPFCDEGMALEDDNTVGYYKGEWAGEPTYFLSWSAFEVIWKEAPNATFQEKLDSIDRAREAGNRLIHPTTNTFGRALGLT